jgi:pilus assembly protein TadC
VLAALAALAVVALLGLPAGVLLAPVAAAAVDRLVRRAGAGAGPSAAVAAEVPVACDLLAVCLGAGAPLTTALGAVGTAVGGAVGHDLAGVAARLRLGSAPRAAWASTAPELAALARVLVRAGESGSGAVPALRALAVDARQGARARAGAAVARSGVWVLAPLGLCFLPAFLCLGVVPLVLGIAHDVFG